MSKHLKMRLNHSSLWFCGFSLIIFANSVKSQTAFEVKNSTNDVLLHVENDGKIGIGVVFPTVKLEIGNGDLLLDNDFSIKFKNSLSVSKRLVSLDLNDNQIFGDETGSSTYLNSGEDIFLSTNGSEKFTILNGGNVGVGTTTPSEKIEVSGIIYSTIGGFKFPDGTIQITASGGTSNLWDESNGNIFRSTGNVGIGNTNPNSPLDVTGDINFTGNLLQNGSTFSVDDADADPNNEIQDLTLNGNNLGITGSSNTVILPNSSPWTDNGYGILFPASSGTVGIGSSIPGPQLAVEGDTKIAGDFSVVDGSSGGFNEELVVITDDGNDGVLSVYKNGAITSRIRGDGDSYFNGGNIGIGVQLPKNKLDISGAMVVGSGYAGLSAYTAPTDGMLVQGNVGIGTGTTNFGSFKLAVNGNSTFWGDVDFRDGSYGSNYLFSMYDNGNDGVFEVFKNNSTSIRLHGDGDSYINGGSVGIGTTTPEYKFQVTGGYVGFDSHIYHNGDSDTRISFLSDGIDFVVGDETYIRMYEGSNFMRFNVEADRQVDFKKESNDIVFRPATGTVTGGGNCNIGSFSYKWDNIYVTNLNYVNDNQISDRRLKENIKPVKYGLKSVLAIKPVAFDYKKEVFDSVEISEDLDKARKNQMGFMAQDIQKVIPEMVVLNDDTDFYELQPTELIPVLVNAIKELNETNEVMRKDNESLLKRIERLELLMQGKNSE